VNATTTVSHNPQLSTQSPAWYSADHATHRPLKGWYLVYIGTRPSGRGKGYARKVIEYVTGIADAAGRACYLESSNEVNRIIYGKLGFERRKIVYLQRAVEHVELDIMVREPVMKKGVVVGSRGGVKA